MKNMVKYGLICRFFNITQTKQLNFKNTKSNVYVSLNYRDKIIVYP